MNIGGGEAADQLVRMMLSGGEVAVRLTGSAMKNLLAISLALAKSHKKISGKIRMGKMLQQTRDLRVFPMTQEEYRDFRHKARGPKLLYAAIQNSRDTNDLNSMVDVTHKHRRSLNVLVIGGSGAAKTRSYVLPNILETNTNYVITDPKMGATRS